MEKQFKVFLDFALNDGEVEQMQQAFGNKAVSEPSSYSEETGVEPQFSTRFQVFSQKRVLMP